MDFEWDPEKNAANIRKHGIDFHDAIRVFDGLVWEVAARYRADEEPRWLAIAVQERALITVIFTWRGDNRRIISARRSRRNERATYRENFGHDPEGED